MVKSFIAMQLGYLTLMVGIFYSIESYLIGTLSIKLMIKCWLKMNFQIHTIANVLNVKITKILFILTVAKCDRG